MCLLFAITYLSLLCSALAYSKQEKEKKVHFCLSEIGNSESFSVTEKVKIFLAAYVFNGRIFIDTSLDKTSSLELDR